MAQGLGAATAKVYLHLCALCRVVAAGRSCGFTWHLEDDGAAMSSQANMLVQHDVNAESDMRGGLCFLAAPMSCVGRFPAWGSEVDRGS